MLYTHKCKYCGVIFQSKKDSAKYCSRECYAKAIKKEKRGRVYICKECGEEFYSRCGYKGHSPKFCSIKCRCEYAKSHNKKKVYRIVCEECGKVFEVDTNKQHQRFCSKECAYKNRTFYDKGERVRSRIAAKERRKRLTIPIDNKFTTALLIAQRGKCAFCGTSLKNNRTIEHLHPVSKGGNDQKHNIVWICKHCNCQKGALTYSDYVDKYGKWWLVDVLDEVYATSLLIEKRIKSVKRLRNG